MVSELVQAVLEGAHPDTPSILQYVSIEVPVPECPVILLGRTRLALYGNIDFSSQKLNPSFGIRSSEKGETWSDRSRPDDENWLMWMMEMPRSITTRTGKMYLNECHFTTGFKYYLNCVPQIIQDCSNFYLGNISTDQLEEIRRKAF